MREAVCLKSCSEGLHCPLTVKKKMVAKSSEVLLELSNDQIKYSNVLTMLFK